MGDTTIGNRRHIERSAAIRQLQLRYMRIEAYLICLPTIFKRHFDQHSPHYDLAHPFLVLFSYRCLESSISVVYDVQKR